jgi:hypothetical protein
MKTTPMMMRAAPPEMMSVVMSIFTGNRPAIFTHDRPANLTVAE